jgi:hypothetical protein
MPMMYHLCKLSVRSVKGAHAKRHKLDDKPTAVMAAAAATENPCCTNMNGKVTDTKPELMPYGNVRKKMVIGLANCLCLFMFIPVYQSKTAQLYSCIFIVFYLE